MCIPIAILGSETVEDSTIADEDSLGDGIIEDFIGGGHAT